MNIAETSADKIFASEVSIAELTYGALHSNAIEKHLKEPRAIEQSFTILLLGDWVRDYAEIRHALTSKGIIIGDMDILIAVTARYHGFTVVTHNTKHFGKVPGLQCVDWVE